MHPFYRGLKDPASFPQDAERAFRFSLARMLKMTVAELTRRLTMEEWAEWGAFLEAENRVTAERRKQAQAEARMRPSRGRR